MAITNMRQYQITKSQLARFEEAAQQTSSVTVDPVLQEALREQALSQVEELRAEVEAYERIAGSSSLVLDIQSISQFSQALIHGRVAAGLTQKELADRLGVSKQQVQRDEQTGYAQASLERLEKIGHVLGIQLSGRITLEPSLHPLDPYPDEEHGAPSPERTITETAAVPAQFGERMRP